MFFYVFYRNLKEKDHITRNINSKCLYRKSLLLYYYLGLPKIRVGRACATKINLPAPNADLKIFVYICVHIKTIP